VETAILEHLHMMVYDIWQERNAWEDEDEDDEYGSECDCDCDSDSCCSDYSSESGCDRFGVCPVSDCDSDSESVSSSPDSVS